MNDKTYKRGDEPGLDIELSELAAASEDGDGIKPGTGWEVQLSGECWWENYEDAEHGLQEYALAIADRVHGEELRALRKNHQEEIDKAIARERLWIAVMLRATPPTDGDLQEGQLAWLADRIVRGDYLRELVLEPLEDRFVTGVLWAIVESNSESRLLDRTFERLRDMYAHDPEHLRRELLRHDWKYEASLIQRVDE